MLTDQQKAEIMARFKAKPIEEKVKLLDALFEASADAVLDMTPEEIDQELRDAGYDPDKVGKRILARLKQHFGEE